MRILRFLSIAALAASSLLAQMTVYSSQNLAIGNSTQLTAYVPLSPNAVTWSVNGVTEGNSTYGTVSTTGLYTAPTVIPMNNAVKVTATSTAYPTKSASVTITITHPPVQLWSTSPTSVPVGPFTIWLNGQNFGSNTVVNFGGVQLTPVVSSSTSAKLSGTALASQVGTKVKVTATNTGLGGTTSGSVNVSVTAAPPVSVSLSPSIAGVPVNTTKQFNATVTNGNGLAVAWSVNGIVGGNTTVGTVSGSGLYTAPAAIPNPATVTVQASAGSAVGSATVTVEAPLPPPITVTISPSSATIAPGGNQQFTSNVAVTWSATAGSITGGGLYTAPAVAPNPPTATITATANENSSASITVNIASPPNPGPGLGTPNLSAGRFLEQAAFGPTPTDMAHLEQVGVNAWLTEQFNMPETPITIPASGQSGDVQQQYLNRLSSAPDQLRQKVAYALSQIIVISMNKNIYPDQIVPYLQILSHDAFGNYRTLLWDISTSSQMGNYLDLAHSAKPAGAGGANENYAREVMQLFTIGVSKLNMDGSLQLDAQNNPIPNYSQTEIQQVALALTGWTYVNDAWQDFSGPMVPLEANHATEAKSFLGCNLAAGQNTAQDMNGVFDCLFNHPNIAPFIATRLIRSLVTSNPSPAYIQRIARVFVNNGSGVRGDLKAVVTAILTDAEARNDAATQNFGRIREPFFEIIAFVRAMGGSINASNGLPWVFSLQAQTPLTPPSVFSFYSPLYHLPRTPLFAPELQIYTPTESAERANFLWDIISNPATDFTISYTPFINVAGNTQALIDQIDQTLLYGRMPQTMRQSLANMIAAQPDNTSRWQEAIYLAALSGYCTVSY
jgi:uncharacterized protein (DUF1800 family)